ncbi:neo-calmodulin-like [Babylonia areolata]|uniref:neo-calmodulin-like n=1 Tax=Babylonia areolata TaxID=304850 RepID=UPI003FD6B1EB
MDVTADSKATRKHRIFSKCGHELEVNGSKVTEEQFKKIADSFSKLDKNSDGRISVGELIRAQRALGLNPSRKDVLNMVKEIDKDESGFIELNEYVEVMAERLGALEYEKQQMKTAFLHFDKDHSGKLSREEVRRLLTSNFGKPMTEEELNDVISDMDRDGDGAIDVDELCSLLCQQQSSST